MKLRLTPLGGGVLGLGVLLLSSSWWPGTWLPLPVVTILGGVLLAAVLVAVVGSVLGLRRLGAEWSLPSTVTAREEVAASALVRTPGYVPAFTIEAWEPQRRRLRVAARVAAQDATALRPSWTLRFPRRGLHHLPPLVLGTRLPLGLVMARRSVGTGAEILVLPARGHLRRRARELLDAHVGSGGLAQRHEGEDLAHLRPYRPGDHPRSVHWRATARTGRLVVAERETPQHRDVTVVLDLTAAGLERRVVLAATVLHHVVERGRQPYLHLGPDIVAGPLPLLLAALAMVAPGERPVVLPPAAILIGGPSPAETPDVLRLDAEVLARTDGGGV